MSRPLDNKEFVETVYMKATHISNNRVNTHERDLASRRGALIAIRPAMESIKFKFLDVQSLNVKYSETYRAIHSRNKIWAIMLWSNWI